MEVRRRPCGNSREGFYEAARARIGDDHIHVAHQLRDLAQDEQGVTATFARRDAANEMVTARADALIAADGIHSTVRHHFCPDEGAPTWNGVMLWRGTVAHAPFMTGRSMIIAGGMHAKLVLYPICNDSGEHDKNLLNWAVAARLGDGSTPPPRREDWSRQGQLEDVLPHVEGVFHLDAVIRWTSFAAQRSSSNIQCVIAIRSSAGRSVA